LTEWRPRRSRPGLPSRSGHLSIPSSVGARFLSNLEPWPRFPRHPFGKTSPHSQEGRDPGLCPKTRGIPSSSEACLSASESGRLDFQVRIPVDKLEQRASLSSWFCRARPFSSLGTASGRHGGAFKRISPYYESCSSSAPYHLDPACRRGCHPSNSRSSATSDMLRQLVEGTASADEPSREDNCHLTMDRLGTIRDMSRHFLQGQHLDARNRKRKTPGGDLQPVEQAPDPNLQPGSTVTRNEGQRHKCLNRDRTTARFGRCLRLFFPATV